MYFFYILTLIIYVGTKLTFCSRKSQRIHHFVIHITSMSLNPMVSYRLAFRYLIIYRLQISQPESLYSFNRYLAINIHVNRTQRRAITQCMNDRPYFGSHRIVYFGCDKCIFPTFDNHSLMKHKPTATTLVVLTRTISIHFVAQAFCFDQQSSEQQPPKNHCSSPWLFAWLSSS